MPQKRNPSDGMIDGFIIDANPFMERLEWEHYERTDGESIAETVKLSTALNRCPGTWVDAICDALRIRGVRRKAEKIKAVGALLQDPDRLGALVRRLADDERALLGDLLGAGGWSKYHTLARRYGDEGEDSFFWSEHPPTSPIGRLRLHGLVAVGRMVVGKRREKVLVVPADLRAPLAAVLGAAIAEPGTKKTPAPAPDMDTVVYELEVSLLHSDPRIWRRLTVPSGITLTQLHRAIQAVMGWDDSHLHEWVVEGTSYSEPSAELEGAANESRVRLHDLITRRRQVIDYTYDFGDEWRHRVTVFNIRPQEAGEVVPRCLDGANACPPEDSGGLYRYQGLCETMAHPGTPDYEEMLEWLGGPWDPAEFSVEEASEKLLAVARRGRWAAKRQG